MRNHSRKIICAIFLVLLLNLSTAHAATTTWASTNLGPYKSTDGGVTWQPVRISVSNNLLQGTPDIVAIVHLRPGNIGLMNVVNSGTAHFTASGVDPGTISYDADTEVRLRYQ